MRALPEDRDAESDPQPDAEPAGPAAGPDEPDPAPALERIGAVAARTGRLPRVAAKLDAITAQAAQAERGRRVASDGEVDDPAAAPDRPARAQGDR